MIKAEETIIAQAAEAIILRKGDNVIKRRIKKGYRIPEIDEKLRKLRTRQESKLLEKAGKLVPVPKIINVNEKNKEIEMEFIQGRKLSESLNSLKNKFEIMQQVGQETAKLHDADIIHGDLTTSNMILAEKNIKNSNNQKIPIKPSSKKKELINKNISLVTSGQEELVERQISNSERASASEVFIIDFGLGFISKRIEDKAVDLHLIKQALEAKHFQNHEKLFSSFLKGYKPRDERKILEQLKKVELRGRYKKGC